ncbi:helix-turn-helix domain-containing protein [Methylomonas sp. SURF-1]|uniref:Helix-turn-helix domain-containing protein n=1 Tax=Methylomonas aurea TaxID=2952224 RepID=A0ABT1UGU2_9GAMM|nr:helix-turn-helix domain-containing protein [Methylomonas sp. SURF-1]MCQ8181453.1 helix-turn-helix domain-containing protein [Methylomonas sp. SURF-1]
MGTSNLWSYTVNPSANPALRLSTADLPPAQRRDWLHEVIGREYAKVRITPPKQAELFNEMTIYPWRELRLSAIRSNSIGLHCPPSEPETASQDAYFAVVLLSGRYRLQQDGREAELQAGDIALYDATRPHRIDCPEPFAKLLVSIPRQLLKQRLPGVEHCSALRIPGGDGLGAVTADFLRSTARQADCIDTARFAPLAGQAMDLLALTLNTLRPGRFELADQRTLALNRSKRLIESRLADPELDSATIARAAHLSPRYLNALFNGENTSLMRYVWLRRLQHCAEELRAEQHAGRSLTEIALRWGFNDMSHFSRAFKRHYGCTPSDYRHMPR